MLMLRETWRIVANLAAFTVATRRVWVLLAVVAVVLVALTTTTVTVLGPISVYPLI